MLRFIKEKSSFPLLRFSIGKEPFKRKRLDEIASKKISYGIVQAGEHVPNGMPYIKSQNLNESLKLENLKRTSLEIAKKYRRSEVTAGDIVFSLRGNIGVAKIVPKSIAVANLTQGTARISVGNDYNKYIFCALHSSDVAMQIEAYAKGSTFREISLEDLRKVTVTIPTLPEQKKIADFLTSVDKRIEHLTQKKSLLEQYKKGAMQQLFTQAIRFKDDDGNDFPDWEEKKLGAICSFSRGKHIEPKNEGGFELLTMGSVGVSGNLILSRNIDHGGGFLKKNDLVMPERDIGLGLIIGKVARIESDRKYILGANLLCLRPDEKVSSRFLHQYINSETVRPKIRRLVNGSVQLMITSKVVESVKIAVPKSDEQTKIADFLTAIDSKIESVANQITENQTFKKGLLQQMFV